MTASDIRKAADKIIREAQGCYPHVRIQAAIRAAKEAKLWSHKSVARAEERLWVARCNLNA